MARTISLAAAVSLALLGAVLASLGTSPEALAHGRTTWSAETGSAPAVQEAQPVSVQPARVALPQASMPLRPEPGSVTLRTALRPVSRPVLVAARPPVRGYAADGPLAHRVMDPTFGPEVRPADLLVPDPPRHLAGADDLLCTAVAIYHEARDQPLDGQFAVASVILNRTAEPERWGATPCEVVVPVQFSFMAADGSYPAIPKDEAWAIAVEMAREAFERGPSPLVGAADHYHTPAVDPEWNEDMHQVVRIEDHIFFVDAPTRG